MFLTASASLWVRIVGIQLTLISTITPIRKKKSFRIIEKATIYIFSTHNNKILEKFKFYAHIVLILFYCLKIFNKVTYTHILLHLPQICIQIIHSFMLSIQYYRLRKYDFEHNFHKFWNMFQNFFLNITLRISIYTVH